MVAIAPMPAETKPPAPDAARPAAAAPRRPTPAAPAAGRACAPEPRAPSAAEWVHETNFFSITSGPSGSSAASALLVSLSWSGRSSSARRPQVAADQRAGAPAQPLGDLAELDPDLVAGQQPRLGRLGQRDPRAHEQRLDARHRRLHRLGDLLVGERVHLAQHQRGALGLRQLVDVADEQAELLALVDLVGGAGAVLGEVDVHRVDADRLGAAQVVEAAVARDPVQPGPDVDRAVVGEHRVEGGGEHLLQHVLGVLARAEQVAAEGEQARLVARDERLEGGVVAAAHERDQPLVGLQAQQRRAAVEADTPGVFESRDFHPAAGERSSVLQEHA